jgi:PhnB protein
MAAVKPIPEGYRTVTPHLYVKGGAEALEFYKKAFGAEEIMRFPMPDGRLGHAEFRLGDSVIMMADEYPEMNVRGPKSLGGAGFSMALYVEDVDAFVQRAVAAGAKLTQPVQNKFYGDRTGTLEDPFGHVWNVATHIEDVSEEELRRRASQQQHG